MTEIPPDNPPENAQFSGRGLAEELSAAGEELNADTGVEQTSRDGPPIFFAGGLGYDANRNLFTLSEISARGHNVLPPLRDPLPGEVDPGFSVTENGETRQASRKETLAVAHRPEIELSVAHYQQKRAELLIETLDSAGIGRIDAIFQSADTLMGILAAHQRPDLFADLVLAYPVLGEAPDMTDKGLIARVVAEEALTRLRREHRANRKEYSFEDRLSRLRAARESRATKTPMGGSVIYSVGSSKQSPLLHELRQREAAPGVGILIGTDDIMLSPKRILASIQAPEDVDAIMVVNTPHGMNGRGDVLDDALELLRLTKQEKARRLGSGTRMPFVNRLFFARDVSDTARNEITLLARATDTRLGGE